MRVGVGRMLELDAIVDDAADVRHLLGRVRARVRVGLGRMLELLRRRCGRRPAPGPRARGRFIERGAWKVQGRVLEGSWKGHGRVMEGSWKAPGPRARCNGPHPHPHPRPTLAGRTAQRCGRHGQTRHPCPWVRVRVRVRVSHGQREPAAPQIASRQIASRQIASRQIASRHSCDEAAVLVRAAAAAEPPPGGVSSE